jgi:hypothetical protein
MADTASAERIDQRKKGVSHRMRLRTQLISAL